MIPNITMHKTFGILYAIVGIGEALVTNNVTNGKIYIRDRDFFFCVISHVCNHIHSDSESDML